MSLLAGAELSGNDARVLSGSLMQISGSVGTMVMALSGLGFGNFRYIHFEIAALYFFTYSYVW